uniref:KASH domain-containing protein n=1 Tax=Timema cristinae TaxID=61476 RepID=A0A7R9GQT9_TIMCR|nr:unnamed protein product [Timema cristinae]
MYTRCLLSRWETLQSSVEDSQRVQAFERDILALKAELLQLAARVNTLQEFQDRAQLEARILKIKKELSDLKERKPQLLQVNHAVHRFLTDTSSHLGGGGNSPPHPACVLKDDVAELYRVWDDAYNSTALLYVFVQNLKPLGGPTEALDHLAAAREDLDHDHNTLRLIDTSLKSGPVSAEVTAQVRDIANVLSEKQEHVKQEGALKSQFLVLKQVPSYSTSILCPESRVTPLLYSVPSPSYSTSILCPESELLHLDILCPESELLHFYTLSRVRVTPLLYSVQSPSYSTSILCPESELLHFYTLSRVRVTPLLYSVQSPSYSTSILCPESELLHFYTLSRVRVTPLLYSVQSPSYSTSILCPESELLHFYTLSRVRVTPLLYSVQSPSYSTSILCPESELLHFYTLSRVRVTPLLYSVQSPSYSTSILCPESELLHFYTLSRVRVTPLLYSVQSPSYSTSILCPESELLHLYILCPESELLHFYTLSGVRVTPLLYSTVLVPDLSRVSNPGLQFLSTEGGSLSDSGISDSGSENDLNGREKRLTALRQLARSMAAALAPGCAALLKINQELDQTEAQLRALQKSCRDLIVNTAVCMESNSLPLRHITTSTHNGIRSVFDLSRRRKSSTPLLKATSPDADPDDPDDKRSGRWSWRLFRASLPFHVALVALFCVAWLLEPTCCDAMNNLVFSLTPQLRYVRGPPPT